MKKLINNADTVVSDFLKGFALAHADIVQLNSSPPYIRRCVPVEGKVALISGGGSGHEPLHAGFVGRGMLDAACPGEIFTSPSADQIAAAIESCDTGAGALLIVKNYQGDVMNFEMAEELVNNKVATVLVSDDASTAIEEHARGIAGTLVVEKIVGAAAETGLNLSQLKQLGDRVVRQTKTMGLALSGCTLPSVGRPTFELNKDELEFGVGIHGERGHEIRALRPAAELTQQLLETLVQKMRKANKPGDALLVVNGLGATPLIELYILYNEAHRLAEQQGFRIVRSLVGNFVTSLDMAGCSITLTLLDGQLTAYWDQEVNTAALCW